MANLFPHIRRAKMRADGQTTECCMVRCSACGEERRVVSFGLQFAGRVLTQRGWEHGADFKRAVCPECVGAREAAKAAPKPSPLPAKPIEVPMAPTPPKAETPRTPQPADNRRIHEALDAAYDIGKSRYFKAGDDASVALRLSVPRAWVAAVREQFFGPDTNEAKQELPSQIKALQSKFDRLSDELLAKSVEVDEAQKELRALAMRVA